MLKVESSEMSSGVAREAHLCTLRARAHVYFINTSTASRFSISIFHMILKGEKPFVSQVSIFPAVKKEVSPAGGKPTLAQVRLLKGLQGSVDVFGGREVSL